MARLHIDKSLAKGTAKQRAILLANHIAELNLGGKGLLTAAEYESLSGSFKTDAEVSAYHRYRKVYDEVRNFLPSLAQWRFAYAYTLEKLEKLTLLRRNNYDFEDVVNNLFDLMPDKKTKAEAIKRVKGFTNLGLFRGVTVDKEGYIQTTPDDGLLDGFIRETRETAIADQVRLKTGITLVKDYLSETGLNIMVFTAFVKEIENWAKSKKGFANLSFGERLMKGSNQAVREIIQKDVAEKPYAEVEIDQRLYDKWREDFF